MIQQVLLYIHICQISDHSWNKVSQNIDLNRKSKFLRVTFSISVGVACSYQFNILSLHSIQVQALPLLTRYNHQYSPRRWAADDFIVAVEAASDHAAVRHEPFLDHVCHEPGALAADGANSGGTVTQLARIVLWKLRGSFQIAGTPLWSEISW